jgi:hypothetical protein
MEAESETRMGWRKPPGWGFPGFVIAVGVGRAYACGVAARDPRCAWLGCGGRVSNPSTSMIGPQRSERPLVTEVATATAKSAKRRNAGREIVLVCVLVWVFWLLSALRSTQFSLAAR